MKTPISRELLNTLYCEFYHVPNDSLKIHYQDKVWNTAGKRSVLFLDEMNRGHVSVLNASLQLILDKKLNSHVLPRVCGRDTLIVAAINPADGDYTTNEFDPALLDRFVTCSVEPDIKSFLAYAKTANLNNTITDFLTQSPKFLHFTPKDGGKGPTPRSWAHLSQFLTALDQMPKGTMTSYFKGVLGDVVASEFLIYYNNYSKALSPEDIIKAVEKAAKKTSDVEKIAKSLDKLLENQEPLQLSEMASKLQALFINKEGTDAIPYLAFLYALPAETLASYIQATKQDMKVFKALAEIDRIVNNKQLFKKLLVIGK